MSTREVDVLRRLAKGMVYKQIAAELGLSTSTIRTHLHNVYGKLGAMDRAQAVLIATERGLDLTRAAQPAPGGRCVATPPGAPLRSGEDDLDHDQVAVCPQRTGRACCQGATGPVPIAELARPPPDPVQFLEASVRDAAARRHSQLPARREGRLQLRPARERG